MLSVAEEILLLALDDEGDFIHPSVMIFQLSIAGAVLMDLALHERIDTDLDHLVVVDEAPTGDDVMDEVLRTICRESKVRDAAHWVNAVATDAEAIKQRLLARLVDRGILKSVDKKYMWIFGNRRYPMIDDREDREVKLRIFSVDRRYDLRSRRHHAQWEEQDHHGHRSPGRHLCRRGDRHQWNVRQGREGEDRRCGPGQQLQEWR